MRGNIIPMPARYNKEHHRTVGDHLRDAFDVSDDDMELTILASMADTLLAAMRDYRRPDCRVLLREC